MEKKKPQCRAPVMACLQKIFSHWRYSSAPEYIINPHSLHHKSSSFHLSATALLPVPCSQLQWLWWRAEWQALRYPTDPSPSLQKDANKWQPPPEEKRVNIKLSNCRSLLAVTHVLRDPLHHFRLHFLFKHTHCCAIQFSPLQFYWAIVTALALTSITCAPQCVLVCVCVILSTSLLLPAANRLVGSNFMSWSCLGLPKHALRRAKQVWKPLNTCTHRHKPHVSPAIISD